MFLMSPLSAMREIELTPKRIPCPVINLDVVDAEDAAQIYPPGGGLFGYLRNDTLSSPDT